MGANERVIEEISPRFRVEVGDYMSNGFRVNSPTLEDMSLEWRFWGGYDSLGDARTEALRAARDYQSVRIVDTAPDDALPDESEPEEPAGSEA